MSLAKAEQRAMQRQQKTHQRVRPCTVTIAGTDYAGSVEVGNVKPEQLSDMTWRDVQVNVFFVSKSLLTNCPTARTKVLFDDREFYVTRLAGQQPSDVDWVITAKRILSKQVS